MELLGQEIERQQFDSAQEIHEFSNKYEMQKKELLKTLERGDKSGKGIRKLLQAAAVFAILVGLSITAYALASQKPAMEAVITNTKETKTMSFEIKRNKAPGSSYIHITPGYLPLGYEAWAYEKYSYGGVAAAGGLTISSYAAEKDTYEYEAYEEQQIGDARTIILDKGIDGDYPRWFVLMFYEQEGHTIAVWGDKEIEKEELLKICENLTYEEVSEKEYREIANEPLEKEKGPVPDSKILELNQKTEFPEYARGFYLQVTDIRISDKVKTELLGEETTNGLEFVEQFITEDKEFASFKRKAFYQRENKVESTVEVLNTVSVKNVEVAIRIENTTDKETDDLPIYPLFKKLEKKTAETYEVTEQISGYREENGFLGFEEYRLGGVPYYFDSSANTGENRFFYTHMLPNSEKEVHFSFAVPEDELETGYIQLWREYYIKIKE